MALKTFGDISTVFRQLRKHGYACVRNASDAREDALLELERYVYTRSERPKRWEVKFVTEVYLYWGGDAALIVRLFREAGFTVNWTGKADDAIHLTDLEPLYSRDRPSWLPRLRSLA